MGLKCGVNNLIGNKGKIPLVTFLIALLILSSCPLKKTIYSLLGGAETAAVQHDRNKTPQVRISVQETAVKLCISTLKSEADVVYSQFEAKELKAPVLFLTAFAIAFNFLCIFFARISLSNAFGQKALVPAYSIHIKNCLFRI